MNAVEAESQLSYCADMMSRARNDTDRLAGLMLLPGLLKNVSPSMCPDLFDKLAACISPQFLESLLESNQAEAAEAALAILSRLYSGGNYALKNESYLKLTLSIANAFVRLVLESNEISKSVVEDSLTCLAKLAATTKFDKAKDFICKSFTTDENFYKCFEKCLHQYPSDVLGFYFILLPCFPKNEDSYRLFHKIVLLVLDRIKCDKTIGHFELLEEFSDRLLSVPLSLVEFYAPKSEEKWPDDVRLLIRGILASRLGDKERRIGFKACSAVLLFVGSRWISIDQEFLQLVVNLCCVEVRMALDDDPPRREILSPCCTILETGIRILIEQSDNDDSSQIEANRLFQMNDVLLELVKFALVRLMELSVNVLPSETERLAIIWPIYSLTTAYLEEGEELIGDELLGNSSDCLSHLSKIFETARQEESLQTL